MSSAGQIKEHDIAEGKLVGISLAAKFLLNINVSKMLFSVAGIVIGKVLSN